MTSAQLENLLENADWKAVGETHRLGAAALPALKTYASSDSYESRRLAVVCAATLDGDEAAKILARALGDENINVRLAAAGGLTDDPPTSTTEAVVAALESTPDETVREALVLAAGSLPGETTLRVLRKISSSSGQAARNSRAALARLGDEDARAAFEQRLSSGEATERYEALSWLPYVNDSTLAARARQLLNDEATAITIGSSRAPRYRRVCDQAVDVLIALGALKVPFDNGPESIYTDEELQSARRLAR